MVKKKIHIFLKVFWKINNIMFYKFNTKFNTKFITYKGLLAYTNINTNNTKHDGQR